MGIFRGSKLETIDGTIPSVQEAKHIEVGDFVMNDMSVSKVYFKDTSDEIKVLLKFIIHAEGVHSPSQSSVRSNSASRMAEDFVMVTPNHIMLRIREEDMADQLSDSTSSSDGTKIPVMLKCDYVPARLMKVGDLVPRWGGGFGMITSITHEGGRSTQLLTKDGLLMINRDIISCYVEPYETIRRLSGPVKHLSGISPLLVSKPFYYIPKKIYKFGLDHS